MNWHIHVPNAFHDSIDGDLVGVAPVGNPGAPGEAAMDAAAGIARSGALGWGPIEVTLAGRDNEAITVTVRRSRA